MSAIKVNFPRPVVIIGGGPAGIIAAIQLVRHGIPAVLFEKDKPGGLMIQAGWIENYPGFPAGIAGEDLARVFCDQLSRFPIDIRDEEIVNLDYDPDAREFPIHSAGDHFAAARVIVASGTKPRRLPILASVNPEFFANIFYARNQVPARQGTRVAIIGAGDVALDYALSLKANHEVIILCRGETCRALPLLQKRIQETRSIEFLFKTEIAQVTSGQDHQLRLLVKNAGNNFCVDADYVLCAIGREANKDFYSERLLRQERKLTAAGLLFLAGDVRNGNHRQIGIAVGDGLASAMTIAGVPLRRGDESCSEDH